MPSGGPANKACARDPKMVMEATDILPKFPAPSNGTRIHRDERDTTLACSKTKPVDELVKQLSDDIC